MSRTMRAFIALELSPEVLDRATRLLKRLKAVPARVRWTAIDNLHLTLNFLGEIRFNDLPAILGAMNQVVAEFEPFDVDFHGLGAFPNALEPRTLWLGVGAGSEQLVELQSRLAQALAAVGFPGEARRFVPHLTLGRLRESGDAKDLFEPCLEEFADYDGGQLSVFETVLLHSDLSGPVPVYESLGQAALGKG